MPTTSPPATELYVRRQMLQMMTEANHHFTVTLDGYVTATVYNNHITNTNNPHSVTASQVGALTQSLADVRYYTKARIDTAIGNRVPVANPKTTLTTIGTAQNPVSALALLGTVITVVNGILTMQQTQNDQINHHRNILIAGGLAQ